jgi:outer membrane lipoprotein-sorting protein
MKKINIACITLSFVFITLINSSFSLAEDVAKTPTKAEIAIYKNDIKRIEDYLNSINTMVSTFAQEDSEGKKTDGTFYLSRPGKLRWQYNPPTPILIIAKGSLLTYYDSELNQVSHVGLEDSLSGFLTRKVISFEDDDVEIVSFNKSKGEMSITITQKNKEGEGQLTLAFDAQKPELTRMEVVDAIGKTTLVSFSSNVYDKPLDNSLFVLPIRKNNRNK